MSSGDSATPRAYLLRDRNRLRVVTRSILGSYGSLSKPPAPGPQSSGVRAPEKGAAPRRLGFSRTRPSRALALLLIPFLAIPARAQPAVTDESVAGAITKAVDWLKTHRKADGHWEPNDDPKDRYWGGYTALATLGLLFAGENPRSTELSTSLEWLSKQTLHATYVYSLRAQALSLATVRDRERLRKDLDWLIKASHGPRSKDPGAFDYLSVADSGDHRYDNSNTQFGVLGVWMATEAGLAADQLNNFWRQTEAHWVRDQNGDGGWGYQRGANSTASMTAAGLTSLYVVLDRLHAATGHARAKDTVDAIERGLDWMDQEIAQRGLRTSGQWGGYALYGIERVGRASGRKYFRSRDWFREGAAYLLETQREDGSWDSDLPTTAFCLYFLCHGRAPLFMNKLEFGEDWDNYLRDVPALTRRAEHITERLLNWQIVSLDGPPDDLLEAPILYLSGRQRWDFDDQQVARLQEYCRRGGLLCCVVQSKGGDFSQSMRYLARRLFPHRELKRLPEDHPLFTPESQFAIESPPECYEISNGVRTQFVLCEEDIADAWNRNRRGRGEREFQLGCNLYLYATDKSTLRSRLDTPAIALQPVEIDRKLTIARIRHDAAWDPEPYGWQRFAAYLHNALRIQLETRELRLDDPELTQYRIAALTGVRKLTLNEAERAGLRRFLSGGGTLLADAAGGSAEFIRAFEEVIGETLESHPLPVLPRAPIWTGRGIADAEDLSTTQVRRALRGEKADGVTPLRAFFVGNRAAVVYSTIDFSTGLVGTPIFNCRGFDPPSALRVARNLVLFAERSTAERAKLSR